MDLQLNRWWISMNVMAPAYSYESARAQIEAGADELYLGLSIPEFAHVSLSGRGKSHNVSSEKELRKIVTLAHKHDVKVHFTANTPRLHEGFEGLYLKMVDKAIEAGVDALIVGCIPAVLLLQEKNVNVPLHASTFFNTFNIEEIKFLESLGFSRAILPYDITLREIKEFHTKTKLEIEVFGVFGCSNTNGRCLLIHLMGETINVGIPCRGRYTILEAKKGKGKVFPILDAALDCSLCSLPQLMEAGVAAVKLLDRSLPYQFTSQFTRVFKESILALQEGATIEEIKEIAFKNVPWWPHHFCKMGRCKYLPQATESFGYI